MENAHRPKNGDFFAFAVFLAVASRESFRGAAIDLDITPSAVSHSVKGMEQRLGVRLVNRTTRSVSLTEAGERLAAKLRPAMTAIEDALRDVDQLRQMPRGTVRINASEGAIRIVLLPILAQFLKMYPEVQLDIVSDGRLSDIIGEGFDAGIRLAEAVPKDMISVPLGGDVRFAAVASPQYVAEHGCPQVPQDLYRHACVRFRFESGKIYRWEFERHGASEVIDVKGPLTLTDQPLMVEAAMDGVGIAFVPDHLVQHALKDGRLIRLLEDWCPPFPGLCLCYSGHRQISTALRALIDMVKENNPHAKS
ncbi:MAG: LysR family transcriptional regulator [Comamonas sp.]